MLEVPENSPFVKLRRSIFSIILTGQTWFTIGNVRSQASRLDAILLNVQLRQKILDAASALAQ